MIPRMKYTIFAMVVFLLAWPGCTRNEVHTTLPVPAAKTERASKLHPGPEKTFPDYRPKASADTVEDYRPEVSKYLSSFPEFKAENLPQLLSLFQRWNDRAKKQPGVFREGNMILGAPPREYRPSDAELVAGYLGDGLKKIIKVAPDESVLTSYLHFEFEHADVMGSGRFFYCSAPIETKLALPIVP